MTQLQRTGPGQLAGPRRSRRQSALELAGCRCPPATRRGARRFPGTPCPSRQLVIGDAMNRSVSVRSYRFACAATLRSRCTRQRASVSAHTDHPFGRAMYDPSGGPLGRRQRRISCGRPTPMIVTIRDRCRAWARWRKFSRGTVVRLARGLGQRVSVGRPWRGEALGVPDGAARAGRHSNRLKPGDVALVKASRAAGLGDRGGRAAPLGRRPCPPRQGIREADR